MRLGEILNLKWADVDWQRGQLAIRDSKNGEGRVVPLDGTVLGLLKTRRGARDTSPRPACKDNTFPLQGVIFGSPSGGRLTTVRRAFRTACRRSGLADLHFHDLRHTFASLFMQSGGNLYALQKLLGHRSIKMTERYSHLSPGHLKSEVERMQEMWVEVPVRN
jgi:integrase